MTADAAASGRRAHPAAVAITILLLTAISYWWFPGHTILQSDTQIYIPILQHLENPAVLANDIMAERPHVSYTLFDEIALALRRLTRQSFEAVLVAQHVLYRGIGIWGLYLIGTGVGFGTAASLVLAALASLGAQVLGPAVLTVEYEPVPRAFAMPFLLLSMGCFAHGRSGLAALAATAGFLMHPPTVLTYFVLLAGFLLWHRDWSALALLGAGPLLLLLTQIGQPPSPERPELWARIDPPLERIQRMRAPYGWVSLWIGQWWTHYAVLTLAIAAAFSRIRDLLPQSLRVIFIALPAVAWLSIPASYVLLEHLKLAVVTQYQPSRHLLFITLLAVIACAAAAVWAGIRRRYLEAFGFCIVPLLAPQEGKLTSVSLLHFALAAGLAAVLAASMKFRWTAVCAALLPFALIPTWGGVRNYPNLHSQELNELATWARTSTPPPAVFQFADAGRQITPGIFRVRAARALYADWKGGGQVNFLRSFAEIWGERWRMVDRPKPLEVYRNLGIDYVVFSAGKQPQSGAVPVYSNARWVVYRLSE